MELVMCQQVRLLIISVQDCMRQARRPRELQHTRAIITITSTDSQAPTWPLAVASAAITKVRHDHHYRLDMEISTPPTATVEAV